MIRRAQWGAPPLTRYTNRISPSYRTGIIIHHTVTPEGKSQEDVEAMLRMIDKSHKARNCGGIGYNLVVDYAGRLYEARGIDVMGCHTADANARNYGIAYMGDTRKNVTPEAIARIKRAIDLLQRNSNKKLEVTGHGLIRATACPGTKLRKLIEDGEFRRPYPIR